MGRLHAGACVRGMWMAMCVVVLMITVVVVVDRAVDVVVAVDAVVTALAWSAGSSR